MASWYGVEEAGRATASGEIMDPERFTAAHRSLPFGSLVRVTDLDTGKRVEVIVNDRGPFKDGRIIDLSFAAARELDLVARGVAPVRLQVLGLEGPLAERRWRVQAGSFTDPRRAEELKTLLQAEGYSPVHVSPFEEEALVYHRVWVGEFYERDGAEGLLRRLVRDGHQGFVLLAAVASP
jgi:rare lipoprotein A